MHSLGLDRPFIIMSSNGVPVLSGSTHARQFTPLLGDVVAKRYFPLAVVEGGPNLVRDSQFHVEDLARETLSFFDTSDGHLAMRVPMHAPLPLHQPFAVSPSGALLAVMDGDRIAVYAASQLVPAQAGPTLQAGAEDGAHAGVSEKSQPAAVPSP